VAVYAGVYGLLYGGVGIAVALGPRRVLCLLILYLMMAPLLDAGRLFAR
jgi:hypothetical protein